MWRELPRIVQRLEKEVKVIVLRGNGKHFCTGIDLGVLGAILELDGKLPPFLSSCRDRALTRLPANLATQATK